MPFGEVMYRCNAHYCFSSVFRNRVVGLVITLVLMQLFLFSFYLNGLHSQTIVTATHTISSSALSGQQDELLNNAMDTSDVKQHHTSKTEDETSSKLIRGDDKYPRKESTTTTSHPKAETDLFSLNNVKSRVALGDAAKKAFSHMVANNKSTLDIVAMAAKKLSDPIDPMAKLGLNLLLNAINKKGQIEPETGSHPAISSPPVSDRSREKSKAQYANLAQRGLQFLTNGLDSSSINGFDSGMLEMASQFMRQNAKLSKTGFDPQMAKSALNLLMSAVGNQKLDPKIVFGLASKLMQSQSQSGQHDGDMGMNLLSQMLSSGQLTSMLLNGARAMQSADSGETSKSIYRNYMKHASKAALMLKSKSNRIRSGSQRKLGVDLNFKYDTEKIDDVCKNKDANSTLYLVMVISSGHRQMERQAARDTWINDFNNLSNRLKVIFFIAQSPSNNVTLQKSIREETKKYRDIIQIGLDHTGDTEGKVSLLTTLGGFHWLNKNCIGIYYCFFCYRYTYVLRFFQKSLCGLCPNFVNLSNLCSFLGVKQILKVNDDVYVSSSKMLKIMENNSNGLGIVGHTVSHMNPKLTGILPYL